jgi:hypothetical protein
MRGGRVLSELSREGPSSVGAGAMVVERLTIHAPRPLHEITMREAVKAHIAMLAGIRRHFGG